VWGTAMQNDPPKKPALGGPAPTDQSTDARWNRVIATLMVLVVVEVGLLRAQARWVPYMHWGLSVRGASLDTRASAHYVPAACRACKRKSLRCFARLTRLTPSRSDRPLILLFATVSTSWPALRVFLAPRRSAPAAPRSLL
jgi:hypothetical protein